MISPYDSRRVEPAEFAIRVFSTGERAMRIVVTGELDLETSPQLRDALTRALSTGVELVLDLSQVEFIDSTGIHAILAGMRDARINGVDLRISSTLAPQARRLFELVGLLDKLPLVED